MEPYLENTRYEIIEKVPECSLCNEGKQSILKPHDLQMCIASVQFEHPIPAYRMHKRSKDFLLHSKTVTCHRSKPTLMSLSSPHVIIDRDLLG